MEMTGWPGDPNHLIPRGYGNAQRSGAGWAEARDDDFPSALTVSRKMR